MQKNKYKKMDKKVKNLGKELAKVMLKIGTSKMFISKLLGISRPTLDTRLKDGEFSEKQIVKLRVMGFLPKDV